MLLQVPSVGVAHLRASDVELNLDEHMHFELALGSAIKFKLHNSDQVLGCVKITDSDIEAEVMVADKLKAEAYTSIKQGVEASSEERMDKLAKHLPNIWCRALDDQKWQHTTRTTNWDLAKVMRGMHMRESRSRLNGHCHWIPS